MSVERDMMTEFYKSLENYELVEMTGCFLCIRNDPCLYLHIFSSAIPCMLLGVGRCARYVFWLKPAKPLSRVCIPFQSSWNIGSTLLFASASGIVGSSCANMLKGVEYRLGVGLATWQAGPRLFLVSAPMFVKQYDWPY